MNNSNEQVSKNKKKKKNKNEALSMMEIKERAQQRINEI
jgi:hypothetical protein